MPNENLENLVKIGKLKVDPSTGDEVMGLIQRGLVKIEDFKHPGLSIETRFDIIWRIPPTRDIRCGKYLCRQDAAAHQELLVL
jgi:hypothetical protein